MHGGCLARQKKIFALIFGTEAVCGEGGDGSDRRYRRGPPLYAMVALPFQAFARLGNTLVGLGNDKTGAN